MVNGLEFNDDYSEEVGLRSGGQIKLRLVRPGDKCHLVKAFEHLSSASRYKRFFGSKSALSEGELRYFTEMDQYHHFALGAMELDDRGVEIGGIGIARFIRLPSDTECAEVGITVIDRLQGEGTGRLLLERLFSAAIERGIKRLRFECLVSNQEVQRLVEKVSDRIEYDQEPGVLIAEVALPERCPDTNQFPMDVLEDLAVLMRAFTLEGLKLQTDFSIQMLERALDATVEYRNTNQDDLGGNSTKS